MEEAETDALSNLLCCQNESSESSNLAVAKLKVQLDNCLSVCLFVCYVCLFVFCLFICLFQMVPLVKNSTDTLIEKLGEFAESGKSVDVYR